MKNVLKAGLLTLACAALSLNASSVMAKDGKAAGHCEKAGKKTKHKSEGTCKKANGEWLAETTVTETTKPTEGSKQAPEAKTPAAPEAAKPVAPAAEAAKSTEPTK